MTDLAHPSLKLDLVDTTGEIYRTYVFPGFDEITITGTVTMAVSKKDNYHRLWDGTKGHMIPPTWIHLYWETTGDYVFEW